MNSSNSNSADQLRKNLERLRELKKFAEASYDELTSSEKIQFVEKSPNDMPRNRDKVKGKVRLRWNHRKSINMTQYRIDKIQTDSLVRREEAPDPIYLPVSYLREKHYRI